MEFRLGRGAKHSRSSLAVIGAIALMAIMLGSTLAGITPPTLPAAPTTSSSSPVSPPAAPLSKVAPASGKAATFGTDSSLGATVAADEKLLQENGRSPSAIHPPNLHEAPPLSSTGGHVTPLYSVAPAPMGVGYYGLNNTTGSIQDTTVNTTTLAGTYSTSDALGTQTEEFDVSTGSSYNDIQPSTDSYGAQLNAVLTNVTIFGKTSFYNPADPDAPSGCPGYGGNPTSGRAPCPNEFWMQNYIEYVPATHTMQIGDEVWNFSNPTASWGNPYSNSTVDENTVVGFGSVAYGLYFLTNTPSEYGPTINIAYPFTLILYINATRGPCHLDTIPGTGVPSCTADGSTVSMTEPVNELFFNYSVWKTPSQPCPVGDICNGQHVCPAVEPYPGVVCGEYDDLFFNSVNPAKPHVGVPEHGPHGQIGSAAIEANGSAYDPLGLTNDYEFDYGIGSDDGDTNGVAYADGTVGVDYCPQAHTLPNGACAAYSDTPAASDFGGETGETSIGEVGSWTPQTTPTGAGLLTGPGAPLERLSSGPALLLGLWNMSGSTYPLGSGSAPLSYAHISPANAWVGVAAGAGVTDQSMFQVAPTFGWYSYWSGSGGSPTPTRLGSDLFLPLGEYTIEVLLAGYNPVLRTIDLTSSGAAPSIALTPNPATGVYTPMWAFSDSDLANISTNGGSFGVGSAGNQYRIESLSPTVGAPFGVKGSISWLFSNLNDYLFPVWYGEFINSTSSYAQSNPAPSFFIHYPSWQRVVLNFFGMPSNDQFQLYFDHVQNFTLAGTSGIYSWSFVEANPITSVVFNDCKNILVADNSFDVSDRGLEFTHGGQAAPVTANLGGTRNVIWGNTFTPYPQPAYGGVRPPSVSLYIHEGFDRIYDNAFDAYSASLNATASSPARFTNWWNATCQTGYNPLAQRSYPGPTVCEPLSYTQTVNGFSLTGSIIGTHYQGGNYWASYGNIANPYGNIPYTAHRYSLNGPARIGSTVSSFAGDYAPLITTTVYEHTFIETGLPASANPSTFSVQILGTPGKSVLWLNSSSTAHSGGCREDVNCVRFYLPDGNYRFHVSPAMILNATYSPHPGSSKFTVEGKFAGLTAIYFVRDHGARPAAHSLPASLGAWSHRSVIRNLYLPHAMPTRVGP
jgi:thermopsin